MFVLCIMAWRLILIFNANTGIVTKWGTEIRTSKVKPVPRLFMIKVYWPFDIQLDSHKEIQFSRDNDYDSISRWQLLYLYAIIYILGKKEIKIIVFVRQWVGGWYHLWKTLLFEAKSGLKIRLHCASSPTHNYPNIESDEKI